MIRSRLLPPPRGAALAPTRNRFSSVIVCNGIAFICCLIVYLVYIIFRCEVLAIIRIFFSPAARVQVPFLAIILDSGLGLSIRVSLLVLVWVRISHNLILCFRLSCLLCIIDEHSTLMGTDRWSMWNSTNSTNRRAATSKYSSPVRGLPLMKKYLYID